MRASEAKARPVMSTASATTIARVAGFIVDAAGPRVLALRLSKTHGDGDTLHWENLKGFGPDAVTVTSGDAVTTVRGRAAELSGRQFELVGKRVLDDRGDEAGLVEDFDFDPVTGEITTLVTSQGPLAGGRMLGCGSYAVIVRAGSA